MWGVKKIIDEFGVYSKETADAMATASRESLRADIGVGVTGSAANVDKNNSDSVPGSVFFSIDYKGHTESFHLETDEVFERWEFKYFIADAVIKELKKILNMG